MKRLCILALCVMAVFSMSGCVNEEITEILERRDAAMEQYSSYSYENTTDWYVRNDTMSFRKEELGEIVRLKNGDMISKISILDNRGTPIESSGKASYYQKGDYAYYDVEGLGRYKQKSLQSKVNDMLGDYINNLEAGAFKSISVKELKSGGKKLSLKLDTSSIPDETANEFMMGYISFMPDDIGVVSARLISFEYELILDEGFRNKEERINTEILFYLKDGDTARATHEEVTRFTGYNNIEGDHLLFPKDLKDYQDYADYAANLKNR